MKEKTEEMRQVTNLSHYYFSESVQCSFNTWFLFGCHETIIFHDSQLNVTLNGLRLEFLQKIFCCSYSQLHGLLLLCWITVIRKKVLVKAYFFNIHQINYKLVPIPCYRHAILYKTALLYRNSTLILFCNNSSSNLTSSF